MAVDAALLARFYERYADHAVTSARHLDYARTGTLPHLDHHTPTNGS